MDDREKKSFDSYVLLSNIKTHLPLKCFFRLSKDENVKLFWYSLIITIRGQKRPKMRQKGLLKSAQLEKNNFSTEKKYFSNREIKFSQLAVSDFLAGFMSNCFFVKIFFVLAIMWESRFWGSVLGGRGI